MTPTVIIKTAAGVTVEGWDSDQVQAETQTRGGLKVESRSEAEIGRARAAVGDRVLFDVRLKLPGGKEKNKSNEAIEVQMGGEGKVTVRLEAGGDVTLVTDQKVEAIPPNYLLGQIERPALSSGCA